MQEFIAETLNQFPEVKWDRYVELDDGYIYYGWIDRDKDSYKDFITMTFTIGDNYIDSFFVTSSAKHSKEFSKRIGAETHTDCKRVDANLPAVINVTRLSDE